MRKQCKQENIILYTMYVHMYVCMYRVLGNFRGINFSRTQHLRIFAVLNYSRMQNFKFADLTLDFILVQQYVIP